jgi:rare lipoprotein A (peptidoglycan hydrolase)
MLSTLNLKKVLVITFFGAILFVASFVVSGKINAYQPFCDHTVIWGAPECGAPVGGQLMTASYYDYAHAGNPTANGDIFDPMMFTAAHKTMPFGTRLLVSHGGRSAEVVVNDRGPFVDGRDLDLSLAAAETIGLTGPGVAPVEVTVL